MKLEELKKIAEARTKGKWRYRDSDESIVANENWKLGNDGKITGNEDAITRPYTFPRDNEWEDGIFIAQTSNHIDELLAVVVAAKYAVRPYEMFLEKIANGTAGSYVLEEEFFRQKKLYGALKKLEDK